MSLNTNTVTTFTCAFCGKEVRVGIGKEPYVAHIQPACRKFIDMDETEFVRACRKKEEELVQ